MLCDFAGVCNGNIRTIRAVRGSFFCRHKIVTFCGWKPIRERMGDERRFCGYNPVYLRCDIIRQTDLDHTSSRYAKLCGDALAA